MNREIRSDHFEFGREQQLVRFKFTKGSNDTGTYRGRVSIIAEKTSKLTERQTNKNKTTDNNQQKQQTTTTNNKQQQTTNKLTKQEDSQTDRQTEKKQDHMS